MEDLKPVMFPGVFSIFLSHASPQLQRTVRKYGILQLKNIVETYSHC